MAGLCLHGAHSPAGKTDQQVIIIKCDQFYLKSIRKEVGIREAERRITWPRGSRKMPLRKYSLNPDLKDELEKTGDQGG